MFSSTTVMDTNRLGLDAVLLAVLGIVIAYVTVKIVFRRTSKIKSVPGFPILGSILSSITSTNDIKLFLKWMKFAEDDGIYRFHGILGNEIIEVFKPEYVKQVLVTNCKNYVRPSHFNKFFKHSDKGLFLAVGKDHALQRKMMNPLFSYSSVRSYCKSFDEHTQCLIKIWSKRCASGTQLTTVEHDMTNLTVDIICDLAFGYKFNCVGGNSSSPFKTILEGTVAPMQLAKQFLIPFYNYFPLKSKKKIANATLQANEIIDKIIKEKKEMLDSNAFDESNKDLLALMLKLVDEDSGGKMTDEILKANVWTFLNAGHETTSTCLTWTLYHLTKNLDVQDKARMEALQVVKRRGSILPEDVGELTYLTAVLKESLRVTPPGARMLREAIKSDQIGDYCIPAGAIISIPIAGIHNYEKYWREPEKFKPERFLESDDAWSGGISGQTYLPFSSGPRNCIGWKFTMMEMKVILARLLTSFRFSISPDHPEVGNVRILTLKPKPSPKLSVDFISEEEAEAILRSNQAS